MTSTTVAVQWDPPLIQNGILRTFTIQVDELEQHNEDICCQSIPVIEMPVVEELQRYQLQV